MKRSPGESEALGLLGLARRAGAVVSGVEATRRALSAGELRLVVLAEDASSAQVGKVRGLLAHREVPVRWISRREVLGKALGEGPLSAAGIRASSFAVQLSRTLPSTLPDSPEADG